MKSPVSSTETMSGTGNTNPPRRGSSLKILTAIALLCFATLSFAQSGVPDCDAGKLSDYEKLGATGCLIGDKKVSNFQYHPGLTGLSVGAISVTPGTTAETNDPGFLFERKWSKASEDSYVSYDVEGEITGTGKAGVQADLCFVNGTSDTCGAQEVELKVVLRANGLKQPQDNAEFKAPEREIRVVTPVDVAPSSGGTAMLDGFMAVFR